MIKHEFSKSKYNARELTKWINSSYDIATNFDVHYFINDNTFIFYSYVYELNIRISKKLIIKKSHEEILTHLYQSISSQLLNTIKQMEGER